MTAVTRPPASERRAGVAVIGCGAIAHEHLAYLRDSKRVRLLAVCDQSAALAGFARDRFGAEACFTDATAMLGDVRPDVVHVLTPPHTHAPLIGLCLSADAHVICEKPMTGTAAETEALLAEAAAKGRWLIESRNYLYNDVVRCLTRAATDGTVGEVIEIDLSLSLDFLSGPFGDLNLDGEAVRLPGAAIHDFLPHLAYLFLHLAGHPGEIDEARGFLDNLSGNRRAGLDHLDALIRAGGVRGRLRVAADGHPDLFRIILRGSKGTIESDLFNPYYRFDGAPNVGKRSSLGLLGLAREMRRSALRNLKDKVLQHGSYHGLPRMLDDVYRALALGEPSPITAAEMIETARLVDRLVALRGPAR